MWMEMVEIRVIYGQVGEIDMLPFLVSPISYYLFSLLFLPWPFVPTKYRRTL